MAMKGICLLVATDDITCHNIVEKMLQRCVYRVLHVGKAMDAIKAIWEAKDDMNLVLTNIHRLEEKGTEILDDIQKMVDFPIIFMSPNESYIECKGKEIKGAAYILKLSSIEEVNVIWEASMGAEEAEKQEMNKEKINGISDEENITVNNNNNNNNNNNGDEGKNSKEIEKKQGQGQGRHERRNKKRKDKEKEKYEEKGEEEDEDDDDNDNDEITSGDDSPMEKKPRMVWSKDMHQKFLEAIEILGPDKAFPKKIVEVMNMPGLTRENVASHLQKYRICLRRAQEESSRSNYGIHLSSHLTGPCLFPNQPTLLGFNASERYSSSLVKTVLPFQHSFDSNPSLSPSLPSFTHAHQRLSYPVLYPNHSISPNKETDDLPLSYSSDHGFIGLRLTDNGKSVQFGQPNISINNDLKEDGVFSSVETPENESLDSFYHSTSMNYVPEQQSETLLQMNSNSIISPSFQIDSILHEDQHLPHPFTMGYNYNDDQPQAILGDTLTNFNQFSFCNTQVSSSSVQPLNGLINVHEEEEVYIPLMDNTPGIDISFQDPIVTNNQELSTMPNDLDFIKLLNEAGISSHQLLWDEGFNDSIFDHNN